MATFRPAIKADDSYIQKVIKYIPSEIVAGYTVLVGYLSSDPNDKMPHYYQTYYLVILVTLSIVTPIWTFYAVVDVENPPEPNNIKKRAYFHSVISTFAFAIWVYAIGNPLLKIIICEYANASSAQCGGLYNQALGSIILVIFTILTPLIERIFFGTHLPPRFKTV